MASSTCSHATFCIIHHSSVKVWWEQLVSFNSMPARVPGETQDVKLFCRPPGGSPPLPLRIFRGAKPYSPNTEVKDGFEMASGTRQVSGHRPNAGTTWNFLSQCASETLFSYFICSTRESMCVEADRVGNILSPLVCTTSCSMSHASHLQSSSPKVISFSFIPRIIPAFRSF